jgi:predicted nuclease of restriction endonuclease-like (RecB) superfamily
MDYRLRPATSLSSATSCNGNLLFLRISPSLPTYSTGENGHAFASVHNDAEDPMSQLKPADTQDPKIDSLLGELGELIRQARKQALIDHLQSFLLELGKGFSFVARQQRISTDGADLFIDLVFYNYLLKCFVIIDLKRGKLSARDVGQMDMYVRMYDELKRSEGDKPTVGIILSAESNDSVARYSMLKGNEQLFASSYKTLLPSEEELRAELNREQKLIEERMLTQSTE